MSAKNLLLLQQNCAKPLLNIFNFNLKVFSIFVFVNPLQTAQPTVTLEIITSIRKYIAQMLDIYEHVI